VHSGFDFGIDVLEKVLLGTPTRRPRILPRVAAL
jgi:hypothetical protein